MYALYFPHILATVPDSSLIRWYLNVYLQIYLQESFKKSANQPSDAENFSLTPMYVYTWHVDTRWYTSDLRVVTIDI